MFAFRSRTGIIPETTGSTASPPSRKERLAVVASGGKLCGIAAYATALARVFGRDLKGDDRLTNYWYDNSVLGIISKEPADSLKRVRYWIDCGDDDFLTTGNSTLHIALTEKAVPHEFRMRDGAHNWTYWRTGITEALQFIGNSFRQY